MVEQAKTAIEVEPYAFSGDEQVRIFREAMMRWADYVFLLLMVVGPMAVVFLTRAGSDESQITDLCPATIFCGGPVLVIAAYPFWRMRSIRRKTEKLEQKGEQVFAGYMFRENSLTIITSAGLETRVSLDNYRWYIISEGILYLYVAKKNFQPIAVSAFQSEDDVQQVTRWLDAEGVKRRDSHPKGGWS